MPRDLLAGSVPSKPRAPRDLLAAKPAQQSTANSAVLGALDTATFGFADEIGSGLDWAADKLPGGQGRTYDELLALNRGAQAGAQDQHPIAYTGGQVAGAVLPGVGLAKAGVSAGARAVEAGRPLWQVAGLSGVDGALMGAAQGFGSGEGGVSERSSSAKEGAKWGVAGGILAPYIGAGIGAGVRKVVSPVATSSGRQAVVDALMKEGVDLTAGQKTGNRMLGYAESQIGGQKASDIFERQGEQFTAAALKRAGIDAPRATPEVIDDGFRRIGAAFDGLGARNTLVPDNQLLGDIGAAAQNYADHVAESQRAPIVQNMVADIRKLMTTPLQGDRYQSIRSRLDASARSATDPQLAHTLGGIRTALDDAMERSITTNNPADAGAWREARRQYRNMLVIEKAATGAGSDSAMGLISPSRLRNATVQQGKRAYARGQGDFADLARAGEAVLKPLPNSGTAPRNAVMALGMGVPGVMGSIMGSGMGQAGMMAGGAIGIAAPFAAGNAMMSKVGQAYLANQAGAYMRLSPARRAVVDALMRSEASAAAGRLAP